LITRYSNPGDLVYDPFGGLMTIPVRAVKMGRFGMASELNPGYFLDGVNYLKAAESDLAMPALFDVEEFSERQAADIQPGSLFP
jgi:DNA modification methylase